MLDPAPLENFFFFHGHLEDTIRIIQPELGALVLDRVKCSGVMVLSRFGWELTSVFMRVMLYLVF